MTIRDWPEQERPREKLVSRGAAALSDAELLAIFIGSGRRGHSAVDIGREMISLHGSLGALLDLDLPELAAHSGLGPAKASRISAALELGRRYLACELEGRDALTSPRACANYLRARLAAYDYEVFACLFLNSQNRVIAFEELFRGSVARAEVHIREVARRCMKHNASAVIFAHNHPSGVADASRDDRDLTRQLQESLSLFDVRVLDHFIVCRGKTLSFAERGYL